MIVVDNFEVCEGCLCALFSDPTEGDPVPLENFNGDNLVPDYDSEHLESTANLASTGHCARCGYEGYGNYYPVARLGDRP